MPEYRRPWVLGGTYFITIVTYRRRELFISEEAVERWRIALRQAQAERPFEVHGGVVLPDHLHLLISLPSSDDDVSSRIGRAKALLTRMLAHELNQRHEADVWQQRFFDHLIRDEADYATHLDYIHYNPVKHGLVACPRDWPWSSFHHWVRVGAYPLEWCCGNHLPPDHFAAIEALGGE